jgi:hypothetical protein
LEEGYEEGVGLAGVWKGFRLRGGFGGRENRVGREREKKRRREKEGKGNGENPPLHFSLSLCFSPKPKSKSGRKK